MFSFFRKKSQDITGRFAFAGVDIHNHLLPGIDDGSQDPETSLELIDGMMEIGFTEFICTPHVISAVHPNTPATIQAAHGRLSAALAGVGNEVPLVYSAEYMCDIDFEKLVAEDNILPFPNQHILIEMSFALESTNLREVVFQLQVKGLKPILAHPERYGYWYRELKKFNELVDVGVDLQLNLLSIAGYYGEGVKKVADKLLQQNLYTWVGTDLHNHRHLDALRNLAADSRGMKKLEAIPNLKNPSLSGSLTVK